MTGDPRPETKGRARSFSRTGRRTDHFCRGLASLRGSPRAAANCGVVGTTPRGSGQSAPGVAAPAPAGGVSAFDEDESHGLVALQAQPGAGFLQRRLASAFQSPQLYSRLRTPPWVGGTFGGLTPERRETMVGILIGALAGLAINRWLGKTANV